MSQDNLEEGRDSPGEQQNILGDLESCEDDTEEQQKDCELEELRNQNKMYRPYRDTKSHVTRNSLSDDVSSQSSSTATSSMDAREIRTRVKKSLDKKQRDMRRRKRGEASAVTRSRRENRDIVKHGAQSWQDDW